MTRWLDVLDSCNLHCREQSAMSRVLSKVWQHADCSESYCQLAWQLNLQCHEQFSLTILKCTLQLWHANAFSLLMLVVSDCCADLIRNCVSHNKWAPRHTIQGTLHSNTQSPTPLDRTAIICLDFLDALQLDFLLMRLFNAQDVGKPQQVLVSLPLEYSGAMGTSRKLFWLIKKKPMMLVSKSFH